MPRAPAGAFIPGVPQPAPHGLPPGPPAPPRADWWNTEPEVTGPPAAAGPGDRHAPPPAPHQTLTTLGHLKRINHPFWRFYERRHLVFLQTMLTTGWSVIQGGSSSECLKIWIQIFVTLELDRKSQVDLLLLAQSGEAGRAEANEILWELLSVWALKPEYEDLSHKLTALVGKARKSIDRPPRNHRDLAWWRWSCYWEPRHKQWAPSAVPRGPLRVITGPGGEPLPPPHCWAQAAVPQAQVAPPQ